MQSLVVVAALIGLVSFNFLPACSPARRSAPLPGNQLLSRVEARLEKGRGELRKSIGHYARVYEVEPEELQVFMAQIYPRAAEGAVVMGGLGGIELHGGGVLQIIASLWKPGDRPAELSDAYPFVSSAGSVPLREIYESLREQVFLPVPGLGGPKMEGRLPDGPALARARVKQRVGGRLKISELDAFSVLALLLRYEENLDETWTNGMGQRLTTRFLLDSAWDHYLTLRGGPEELSDHSNLHLIEILLSYWRRLEPGEHRDPHALKRQLLEVDFERSEYGAVESSEALGHFAESLGLLLSEPRVSWSEVEKDRVRVWLAELERTQLKRVDSVPVAHLSHLWLGLRLIQMHGDRLR